MFFESFRMGAIISCHMHNLDKVKFMTAPSWKMSEQEVTMKWPWLRQDNSSKHWTWVFPAGGGFIVLLCLLSRWRSLRKEREEQVGKIRGLDYTMGLVQGYPKNHRDYGEKEWNRWIKHKSWGAPFQDKPKCDLSPWQSPSRPRIGRSIRTCLSYYFWHLLAITCYFSKSFFSNIFRIQNWTESKEGRKEGET